MAPSIVRVCSAVQAKEISTARSTQSGVNRLKRLGELRDPLLLAGGGLYVLGYVVWSVHALNEGLGLLPALELQYLLAGSLLVLIFLAALILGFGVLRLDLMADSWEHSPRLSVRLVGRTIFWVAVVAITAAAFTLVALADAVIAWIVFLALMAVGYLLLQFFPKLEQRVDQRYEHSLVALVGFVLAYGAAVFYLVIVYPNVPQELGGVKPRCGYLDVARADASPSLAQELLAGRTQSLIVRSRKLSIFFSSGDAYIVRAQNLEGAHTYEVRKDIVKSVSDC
jgi:hypothetical protein